MVCRAAVSPGPVTTCHATVTGNAKCRFMNTTCGGHPRSRRGRGGRQQVSHGGCEPSRDGLRERRVSFHEHDNWRLTTEPQGRGRPSPGVTPRLRAVTRRSQGTPSVVSRARQLAPTAKLARPGSAQANEYPPLSCLSTHGALVIELNRWNDCRSAYPALCRLLPDRGWKPAWSRADGADRRRGRQLARRINGGTPPAPPPPRSRRTGAAIDSRRPRLSRAVVVTPPRAPEE